MTTFKILSLGNFVDHNAISITLKSFSLFFKNLTSKHHNRIKLTIIKGTNNFNSIEENFTTLNLQKASVSLEELVEVISINEKVEVQKAYEEADLFFVPSLKLSTKHCIEALSFSLPILTFYTKELEEIVNTPCGKLVRKKLETVNVELFYAFMEMMYFDPEARKMLQNGAFQKYNNVYSLRRN